MIPDAEATIQSYQRSVASADTLAARCENVMTAATAADEHAAAAVQHLALVHSQPTRAVEPGIGRASTQLQRMATTLQAWSRAAKHYSTEVRKLSASAAAHWNDFERNRRALAEAEDEARSAMGNTTAYGYRQRALEQEIDRDVSALRGLFARIQDEEERLVQALTQGQDRVGYTHPSDLRELGARLQELNPRGEDEYLWQLLMMGVAAKPAAGYDYVDLPLFNLDEDGNPIIRPEDVSQGNYANCWFIATLMSVAAQRPEVIEQMISYDPETGMYTVVLYDVLLRPQSIQVDGQLLLDGDGYTYGAGRDLDQVLWPAIAEKALAEYMGGYPDMEYDRTALGIRLVTGELASTDYFTPGIAEWFDFVDTNPTRLAETLDNGGVAVAWTKGYGSNDVPDGLYARHAYQVVAVDDDVVTLKNPWSTGTDEFPIVELDWDQFHDLFQGVSWTD